MCGICGTIGFSDRDLLKKMCGAMVHRGPDSDGYFLDKAAGLGIRRLRIIDLATGDQPIHNEDETIWLVFNGEIYNFRELRENLEKKGHRFYTNTDTEVIVHLYEEQGEDCVKFLNGMFVFAVWDKRQEKLFIARDRLGVKPLYYAVRDGNLVFASELKALLEYDGISREVDPQALDCFLSFLYVPAPLSIFKGINKLLAGHILTFRNRNLEIKCYWDLNIVKDTAADEKYYEDKLYALLEDAVRIRMVSDVPLGVFLSGGIDSSIVAGLMARSAGRPVKTFTIGYGKKDASYNEMDYARLVAKHFRTDHHEYIIEPNLPEILHKLAWHFDEPFADSSAVPTFIVSRAARENITVALSGIGGDEAFAGYPRYIGAYLSGYYEKIPLFLRRMIFNLTAYLPESTKSRNLAGWAKRFSRGGMLPPRERYLDWVSYSRDGYRDKIYTREMLDSLGKSDARKTHFDYFNRANAGNFLDKIFYLDVKTYLVDDLLFMADRMSMANSLELRVPLCDHRVLEFSASIPYELKIKGLKLKYLLKKAFSGLLPQEILKRKKHGFMLPVGRWLKDDLKEWVGDFLSEANIKKRGYFNYQYIQEIINRHNQGKENFDDRIWALLVLEMWHRVYVDGKSR